MDNTSPISTSEEVPQPAENPNPPHTPTQRKLNWKGFFIGIVIVILIEIFAVQALKNDNKQTPSAQPTPTQAQLNPIPPIDMTNWQTYSSLSGTKTFSFRYPANYIFGNGSKADPNAIEITSPKKMNEYNKCLKYTPVECTKDAIFVNTKPFPKQTIENLDSFLKEQHAEKDYANLEAFKSLTVDGHNAMQGQSPGFSTVRNTFIDLGDNVILITMISDEDTYPNLANQILSTFKFTN